MVEKEQVRIRVQVKPNAAQNGIVGFNGGVLHIRIAAPAVKGKANQELIKFLSNILGTSKSNLTIEKGTTDRRKVISISQLPRDQVMKQLDKFS
jgi:hypothetical protein